MFLLKTLMWKPVPYVIITDNHTHLMTFDFITTVFKRIVMTRQILLLL